MADSPQFPDAAAAPARGAASEAGNVTDVAALVARETGASVDDVRAMLEGVGRGEDEGDYFGLTPAIQASLENCAVAYYRGKRYAEALDCFQALTYLTQGKRSSAWRGAAACHQVTHDYERAVQAYLQAIVLDPDDTLSAAHCGECLCLLGRRDDGVALLQLLVEQAPASEAKSPHMMRAKALLAAGGGPGTPSPMARRNPSAPAPNAAGSGASSAHEAVARAAKQDLREALAAVDAQLGETGDGEAADGEIRQLLTDPDTRERMEQIADAVLDKHLSIRMLADFSDEQMDAGYAVACQHLEREEVLQALQVCLTMLYLDSRDTRFYQLAGLCAHHMALYCLADYFYSLATIWSPNGADAATLIYQGEAKILSEEPDEGLAMVHRGIALGRADPQMAELIRRGEALIKQGAAMRRGDDEQASGGAA